MRYSFGNSSSAASPWEKESEGPVKQFSLSDAIPADNCRSYLTEFQYLQPRQGIQEYLGILIDCSKGVAAIGS